MSKVKIGFYYKGPENDAAYIFGPYILYWDGKELLLLGYNGEWVSVTNGWFFSFRYGSVKIGEFEEFTYIGE